MTTMTVAEWLARRTRAVGGRARAGVIPRAICADGFSLSVQASQCHYCSPRDDSGPWDKVEVAYPSAPVPTLANYADNPSAPDGGNVFGFVPIEVVEAIIAEHGGIV